MERERNFEFNCTCVRACVRACMGVLSYLRERVRENERACSCMIDVYTLLLMSNKYQSKMLSQIYLHTKSI